MNKQYYVYIIVNKTNTVLYVGVTNNLERRVYEHKQKFVEGFTKEYNVDKLVYFEEYESIDNAITREKTIKNMLRLKKLNLIRSMNPDFKELVLD
jgi:putative endonuclease